MCSNGVTQCVLVDKYFPREIINIIAGELTPEERESFRAVHPNLSTIRPMYGPLDFAMSAARGNMAMLELSLTRDARHYRCRFLDAVKANNFEYVSAVIEVGYSLNMLAAGAIKHDNVEMLEFALDLGLDVKGKYATCQVAVELGRVEMVEYLMSLGALVSLQYFDELALKGDLTMLKCLMKASPVWGEVAWLHRHWYGPQVLAWIEECESD
jgi:hypothetical protein